MRKLICVAALVFATGCNTSTLVSDLNAIIAGVDAALPIVQATGAMPLQSQKLATEYLIAVSTATSQAGTVIQSSDSDDSKATKLLNLFANLVLPGIPDMPVALAADLNSISAAVTAFENAVRASTSHPLKMPSRQSYVSEKQKVGLLVIKAKADAAVVQLRVH